jgi:phospholipase C
VWSKTALVITFDENDGFFDHVVAPYPNVGDLRGDSTVPLDNELFGGKAGTPGGSDGSVGPYGLGVRVPLLVVSPWSSGGWVCSETFDHTSLIRFIEARFGVDEPNITPWRRAVCGDLTSAFDFKCASHRVPSLPSVAGYKPNEDTTPPSYHPEPPAVGSMPPKSRACGHRAGSATASTSRSTPIPTRSSSRSGTAATSSGHRQQSCASRPTATPSRGV